MDPRPQVVLIDVPTHQAQPILELAADLGLEAVTPARSVIEIGLLRIDVAGQVAQHGEGEAKLTAQEFALLVSLARRAGTFLSRAELLADAWGRDVIGPRTVDIHVHRLRAKLGDRAVETRVRVGYRLVPDAFLPQP